MTVFCITICYAMSKPSAPAPAPPKTLFYNILRQVYLATPLKRTIATILGKKTL